MESRKTDRHAAVPPAIRENNAASVYDTEKGFQNVLCDVLSGDFDKNNRTEDLVQRTISGTENGSIILFHDSIKAIPRISEALPAVLRYFSDKGYSFRSLDFAFQNDITGKPITHIRKSAAIPHGYG